MKLKDKTCKDINEWYLDTIKDADLLSPSPVRGCMVFRPYGYSIWENIQNGLDPLFKKHNYENVYMPLLIPESSLNKETEHISGFSPQVAWITHGGEQELGEKLCIRPTSEVPFCEHFSQIVKSYRDLPITYTQWCSVVRWEKNTKPFLRTLEFLWHEGYTCHSTEEEAVCEAEKIINLYSDFCKEYLAIPTITGVKTPSETFPGAKLTYTIESLLNDGKALQTATSHYLADNFSKAFGIKFKNTDGIIQNAYQASFAITTRLIGAIIMIHGDRKGLILPPKIAPIQAIIVPIFKKNMNENNDIKEMCNKINLILSENGIKSKVDISDKTVGWKFRNYEKKGVPIRIEVGINEVINNQVTVVNRESEGKYVLNNDSITLTSKIHEILTNIQENLLHKAENKLIKHTSFALDFDEMIELSHGVEGFVKSYWCGNTECEEKIKLRTGLTSRCISLKSDSVIKSCVCCGADGTKIVYWAKSH